MDRFGDWYKYTFVLWEIARCTNNRETVFIGSKHASEHLPVIRCLKAFNVDFLKINFEKYRFYERNFNLYASIATFTDLPMTSFSTEERKTQLGDFFNGGGFDRLWLGLDFVLDIDNDDIKVAYSDAKKVKEVLDEFSVPYSLRFSGNRGFHFVVADSKFWPPGTPNADKAYLSRVIAKGIKVIEGVKSIDTTIYDRERVLKVPYSLSDEYVVLPLSDEQFEAFDKEQMRWNIVFKNTKLMRRGLLEREGSVKYKELLNVYGELNVAKSEA